MEYRFLGQTGIEVSRLCFGTLTIGPLQAGLSLEEGTALLEDAYRRGVTFYDTAESYRTYPYLRALTAAAGRQNIVIATKSYAVSAADAERALDQALAELGTDYIDIFLLHEQLSASTLRGHAEALGYFQQAKQRGLIRAVGLSSHYVAAVQAAVMHSDIDIVHPLYNLEGFGIQDGGAEEMLRAVEENKLMGKGIYAMKALGGGHLIPRSRECLNHVIGLDAFQSIAVGMQSRAELAVNVALFSGEDPMYEDAQQLSKQPRRLHVEEYCQACGLCLMRCPSQALSLTAQGLRVDHQRCLTCGYCAKACPHFALKVL